ncbi:unnamed protein product [Closterium sp. NIES-53]
MRQLKLTQSATGGFSWLLAVVAMALVVVALVGDMLPPCAAVNTQAAGRRPNAKQYIVHLRSVPSVLSYRGGISGLRATATVDDEEDEYDEDDGEDDGAEGGGAPGAGSGDTGGTGSSGGSAGSGGNGGNGGSSTAPGSAAAPAPAAAGATPAPAAPAAGSESNRISGLGSKYGKDTFNEDILSAAVAAAEAAVEIGGVVGTAGEAEGTGEAGVAGVAGFAATAAAGVGGGRLGKKVGISALAFREARMDDLARRVGLRLRNFRSQSAGLGRRLLARVAAAAVAAAAEEAAGADGDADAGSGDGGGGEALDDFKLPLTNSSQFAHNSAVAALSTIRGVSSASASTSAAAGATSPVLTAQQLSVRAAHIMRTTPWGRLMRPDVRLPHVQAFTRFLESSHRSLLRSLNIPVSSIFHSYSYLMNSFAVQLTPAEAKRLRFHPAVADMEPDRVVRMTTVQSPEFLKMDTSLWPAAGGQSSAGEGMIIGVIDSGIWPEHPSFADPDPNGAAYSAKPTRWRGVCTKTADFQSCNNKLIGARYFVKGAEYTFGKLDETEEFRSARDKVQHGTWCAGAAAGNAGVTVTTGGRSYGTASGMAPRARLAVYKALWTIGGYEGTGASSDLIGSAEKAVADGVDVISCSWGGLAMYFQDLPYLRGLKAGVVTAFAAGNEGKPNPSSIWGTLGNVSPFYLTVGASTIGREYKAVLTLGDATTFNGRSLGGTAATGSGLPLILAESALLSGGDKAKAQQCYSGHISRTAVSGKFLVCTLHKRKMGLLLADADSMGAAAILVISGSPKADMQHRMPFTKTPSIFLQYASGKTIKSYIAAESSPTATGSAYTESHSTNAPQIAFSCVTLSPPLFSSPTPSLSPPHSPTATLSAYTESQSTNAPQVAFFSSTGPPRSARYPPALLIRDFPTNDILKPDVMGPGFQLWAAAPGKAVATAATDAPEFNYWSGTSMSTPHLAGIMALIVQEKPNWSPAQVISAITTTAYTKNKNGQPIQRADGSKANAWDYGGGHVDPTRVLDPGLTFHSAQKQFVNFLMGRDPLRAKKRFWRMGKARPIFPWSINRPSIAVTRLHGVMVVYRKVKNVYNLPSIYTAKVDPPPGFTVKVSPKHMVIPPGKSKLFRVTIIRFLPLNEFRFGSILWTDQHGHSVPVKLVVSSPVWP